MSALLKVDNLYGGYCAKTDIVKNVSLKIEEGDFVGILGPNGSGKTTLLRILTRVIRARAGTIYFKDKNVLDMQLREFCKDVAFVAQNNSYSFKVMDFVLMGRIPHLKRMQFETKKDLEIAEKALSLTSTSQFSKKCMDELSAGEQQRIGIAKALAQEPVLLFLDEPTSHLDIGHQIQIMDLLKELNKDKKLTIVMILHDLNLAGMYCNKIILMNEGTVFREGMPEDVLTYQNIEAVYKTIVLVDKNKITNKPNVVLVPKGSIL